MSNIDKRALREAAEKATKGQWAVEFDDEIYSTDGVNHEQIAMVFSENEACDAAFIAAANPATVLALLDELEAKDKLIDNLRQDKDKVIDISKERISKLLARVAELEAREELFLRAKALMHQSGGAPIENSLNPIDAWLYDAERAAAGKGVAS